MTINISELASCNPTVASDYKLLWQLQRLNAERTQGTLVYSPDRGTHDYVIHVEGAPTDSQGYIEPGSAGGVVGSSEWIWLDEKDGKFFAAAANAMTRLLELAEKGLKAETLKE